jgi:metal-responsive CopG/Arc/MetJ family transcriptional regulator
MNPTTAYLDADTAKKLDEFLSKQRIPVSRSAALRAAVLEFIGKKELRKGMVRQG